MRLKSLLAVVAAAISLGAAAPHRASAFDQLHWDALWDRPDQPSGWGRMRTIRHWVYRPRYTHVYLTHPSTDEYAYSYTPRGYYPYHNSGYWGRPHVKRFAGPLPPYYQSWGSNKAGYRHVQWHRAHYGGHRRGDW